MKQEILIIVLISSLILLGLISVVIILFYIFQNSKSRLIIENEKLEQEVSLSKIEIRENFLRNVGKELHDNVGQLLSVAKLQLNMYENKSKIRDSINLIGQSLEEIRNLSKVTDPDVILNMGLLESCEIEVARLNKLKEVNAELIIPKESIQLPQKAEIILFRIVQESLQNIIKHANANDIKIAIKQTPKIITLCIQDNGDGFEMNSPDFKMGSGLLNMRERSKLIGAEFEMQSIPNQGTELTIRYQLKNDYHNKNRHY